MKTAVSEELSKGLSEPRDYRILLRLANSLCARQLSFVVAAVVIGMSRPLWAPSGDETRTISCQFTYDRGTYRGVRRGVFKVLRVEIVRGGSSTGNSDEIILSIDNRTNYPITANGFIKFVDQSGHVLVRVPFANDRTELFAQAGPGLTRCRVAEDLSHPSVFGSAFDVIRRSQVTVLTAYRDDADRD